MVEFIAFAVFIALIILWASAKTPPAEPKLHGTMDDPCQACGYAER